MLNGEIETDFLPFPIYKVFKLLIISSWTGAISYFLLETTVAELTKKTYQILKINCNIYNNAYFCFVFLKKKGAFGHFQNKNDAIELALLNDCVKCNLPHDRFFDSHYTKTLSTYIELHCP